MKILIITGTFPILSETFIVRKVTSLLHAGHQVLVLARHTGDRSLLEKRFENFRVEYLPADTGPFTFRSAVGSLVQIIFYILSNPVTAIRLLNKIRAHRPTSSFIKSAMRFLPFCNKGSFDIIHIEFLGLAPYYSFLKDFLGCKVLVSCRGADMHLLPFKSSLEQQLTDAAIQAMDEIHCVSEEMQRCVTARFPGVPTFVNRPAVDLALVMESRHDLSNDPISLVTTGRLEWKKGYDYLIKAYSLLQESGVPFKATIIGRGALWQELQFSIRDCALEQKVELAGAVPPGEVINRLKGADIFVLSSVEEGISNAVLEAMALGLAVVCTRCGGMEEVVEDGVNGLLVPVRDPLLMANAIKQLVSDADLRRKLGANARETIRKSFTLERQVRVFEETYTKLSYEAKP